MGGTQRLVCVLMLDFAGLESLPGPTALISVFVEPLLAFTTELLRLSLPHKALPDQPAPRSLALPLCLSALRCFLQVCLSLQTWRGEP